MGETAGGAAAAEAAEALIYAALADGWTADRLFEAASGRGADGEPWTSSPQWWTVDESGAVVARLAGERPDGLLRAMLLMEGQDAWA
jgi:hypothetical protein